MTPNRCEICNYQEMPPQGRTLQPLTLVAGNYSRTYVLCDRCTDRLIDAVRLHVKEERP